MGGIHDIITYARFGDDHLRGSWVVWGSKFSIFHWLCWSSLQLSHYRVSVTSKFWQNMADEVVRIVFSVKPARPMSMSYGWLLHVWQSKTTWRDGRLQPDPERFPRGIRALRDYVSFVCCWPLHSSWGMTLARRIVDVEALFNTGPSHTVVSDMAAKSTT